jgi:8-oxo-dGTP pyrophosphatase MutT (NUDIX family)
MALIDHIRRCNRWNPESFHPFWVAGIPVGRVRPEVARWLRENSDLFVAQGEGIALVKSLVTPEARTDALRPMAERMAALGLVAALRGEDYRVVADWGAAPLMAMDRALVSIFGIRAFGIHVNGMVRKPDGIHLWIGKRAANKAVEPGKLDNMVAGGQPANLGLAENLIKEASEEAGLSAEIARQAKPVGAVTYCMEEGIGLKRDTLFLYDLELSEGQRVVPHDGEMESFTLTALPDLLARLRQGFDFKFNVALVLIDFMIRHGVITPETEPDYLDLATGLHTPLELGR